MMAHTAEPEAELVSYSLRWGIPCSVRHASHHTVSTAAATYPVLQAGASYGGRHHGAVCPALGGSGAVLTDTHLPSLAPLVAAACAHSHQSLVEGNV